MNKVVVGSCIVLVALVLTILCILLYNKASYANSPFVVVSYANGGIHDTNQADLGATVEKLGYRHVKYNPSMIPDFVNQHPKHFEQKRGGGYWVWKPHIVLKELERMRDDEILIYIDAGAYLLSRVDSLLQQHPNAQLIAFPGENPEWLHRRYTKRDLSLRLDADTPDILDIPQVESGFFIMRKGAIPIIKDWYAVCSDLKMLDDSPSIAPNAADFIEHRHDQSILHILCYKQHKDKTIVLADKSKLVNHHKRRA